MSWQIFVSDQNNRIYKATGRYPVHQEIYSNNFESLFLVLSGMVTITEHILLLNLERTDAITIKERRQEKK